VKEVINTVFLHEPSIPAVNVLVFRPKIINITIIIIIGNYL